MCDVLAKCVACRQCRSIPGSLNQNAAVLPLALHTATSTQHPVPSTQHQQHPAPSNEQPATHSSKGNEHVHTITMICSNSHNYPTERSHGNEPGKLMQSSHRLNVALLLHTISGLHSVNGCSWGLCTASSPRLQAIIQMWRLICGALIARPKPLSSRNLMANATHRL